MIYKDNAVKDLRIAYMEAAHEDGHGHLCAIWH